MKEMFDITSKKYVWCVLKSKLCQTLLKKSLSKNHSVLFAKINYLPMGATAPPIFFYI